MKQARASEQELKALAEWFSAREARGESVPEWRRTVYGYEVMFNNVCDPASDVIEWKPGIIAADTEKARLARCIAAELAQAATSAPLTPDHIAGVVYAHLTGGGAAAIRVDPLDLSGLAANIRSQLAEAESWIGRNAQFPDAIKGWREKADQCRLWLTTLALLGAS